MHQRDSTVMVICPEVIQHISRLRLRTRRVVIVRDTPEHGLIPRIADDRHQFLRICALRSAEIRIERITCLFIEILRHIEDLARDLIDTHRHQIRMRDSVIADHMSFFLHPDCILRALLQIHLRDKETRLYIMFFQRIQDRDRLIRRISAVKCQVDDLIPFRHMIVDIRAVKILDLEELIRAGYGMVCLSLEAPAFFHGVIQ